MNIEYKKLDIGDELLFRELVELFRREFETTPGKSIPEAQLDEHLKNKNFIVFVALMAGEVIGGLTVYQLPSYYQDTTVLYIYDMAIAREWQRKGIGTALLGVVSKYRDDNGFGEIFVQASGDDVHALAFYTSIGAASENVVHFTF